MISIIIPTLNEEKHLLLLLESLKNQTFKDFEVIVSDAGSKDKTLQIAKKWGCKIVKGGLPPFARNRGAEAAKGEILVFFDADVYLPKYFLEKTIKEFKERKLDLAGCYSLPLSDKLIDFILYGIANFYLRLTQSLIPQVAGYCIFVKKKIHQEIGGFNEAMKLNEDFDYAQRASKKGKGRFLNAVKIPISVRRLDKEGRLKLSLKYLFCTIYFLLFGGIKKEIVQYKFAHYNENSEEIEKKIKKLKLK
jgi:glycosyltransferase involved in cell wall biosynthesis